MNARKARTSAVALALASAIALSGTFAWQSISQKALNEAKGTYSNPGGRLHDDFGGPGVTKDIYVENFGEQPIYARVRLAEYMEIGTGAGNKTGTNTATPLVAGTSLNNPDGWTIHMPGATSGTIHEGAENAGFADPNKTFHTYWTWTMGGQDTKNNPDGKTVYMPTFNMNKDSLKADINGTMQGKDGKPYGDYHKYTLNENLIGNEVYDVDTNTLDEGDSSVEKVNHRTERNQTHTAAETLTAKVMTMAEYKALPDDQKKTVAAWVYDTDGWAYWSQPIAPKTATGLLLDKIELVREPQGDWYYGIHAVGQFVTADDLGRNNNTGFFDTAAGSVPSEDALGLLKGIGVNTGDTTKPAVTYTVDVKDSNGGSVTGGTVNIAPGSNASFTTTITASDGSKPTGNWNWSSSDPNVATVTTTENGATVSVPAGATVNGTATITVKNDVDPSATVTFVVSASNPTPPAPAVTYAVDVKDASDNSVKGTTVNVPVGGSASFTTTITASDGSKPTGNWNWSSSDPNVATVTTTENGATVSVPAGAAVNGTATITVKNDVDPSATAIFTLNAVQPNNPESGTVASNVENLSVGDKKVLNGIEFTVLARNDNLVGADGRTYRAALMLSSDIVEKNSYSFSAVEDLDDGDIQVWTLPHYLDDYWLPSHKQISDKAIPVKVFYKENLTEDARVFSLTEADVFGTSGQGTREPAVWEYTYNGQKLPITHIKSTWWLRHEDPYVDFAVVDGRWRAASAHIVDTNHNIKLISVEEKNTGVRPAFWYNLEG